MRAAGPFPMQDFWVRTCCGAMHRSTVAGTLTNDDRLHEFRVKHSHHVCRERPAQTAGELYGWCMFSGRGRAMQICWRTSSLTKNAEARPISETIDGNPILLRNHRMEAAWGRGEMRAKIAIRSSAWGFMRNAWTLASSTNAAALTAELHAPQLKVQIPRHRSECHVMVKAPDGFRQVHHSIRYL